MSIEPRNVTDEELLKLHVPEMISILKGTDGCTDEQLLEELSSRYDFLFIHPVNAERKRVNKSCK